jgi:MinD-like ATPase involved in chromosome partitioning or flagellar assembly
VGVAAELADRGSGTFLIDADGYGGAVAQHLGILDQASGLLAAARLANSGQLDHEELAAAARQVSSGLRLLTGLPRADRWVEVREAAFRQMLDMARGISDFLVLDTSFSLEQEPTGAFGRSAPRRNGMTLEALEAADEVLVVGSADPVGLARLARGLVELVETVPGCAVRVAVNRNRASWGWGEQEVRAMIEGFLPVADIHFLPDDQGSADRALVSGKSLVEIGDSPLRRAIGGVVDAMTGQVLPAGSPRATAGGARSEQTGGRWTLPGRNRTGRARSRARVEWAARPSRPAGQAARRVG